METIVGGSLEGTVQYIKKRESFPIGEIIKWMIGSIAAATIVTLSFDIGGWDIGLTVLIVFMCGVPFAIRRTIIQHRNSTLQFGGQFTTRLMEIVSAFIIVSIRLAIAFIIAVICSMLAGLIPVTFIAQLLNVLIVAALGYEVLKGAGVLIKAIFQH